ncbi:MAG: glycoside hydrolase family 57 protein [Nitrospirota bacterium]
MEKGYLSIVLHAHLPFVRHPEYEDFLEEDWLFEAISETYIPFINVFDSLIKDSVDFRITMSLTPTLIAMLTDPFLQERYLRHIARLIELSESEVERTRWQPQFHELARMYRERFNNCKYVFETKYGRNLVSAFKKFQDMGKLEIITCAATHGFLPLMELSPNAVRAQIAIAVQNYEKHLGRPPRGIWLPECGYYPGLEDVLKQYGIKFFFTDSHGVLYASPRPKYGVFAPIYCPNGVAAFGRDLESSKQVWSAQEGYPGDNAYRDFYRDVGFDLDYDYIRPYLHGDGTRTNLGMKYYQITGSTEHKEPYVRARALGKAAEHAGNFMFNREKQAEHLSSIMDRKPIIVSPYDAELFGHWWFEGPEWLDFLFRKLHFDQDTIRPITPMEYLEENPKNQKATPSLSSWGHKGYAEVWLEGSNDWIYRHLHKASQRMVELARNNGNPPDSLTARAMNQAARELLLAQSSDWAFIMKTGTMVQYAVKRTKDHVNSFNALYGMITEKRIDRKFLEDLEGRDNIFPELDYKVYA